MYTLFHMPLLSLVISLILKHDNPSEGPATVAPGIVLVLPLYGWPKTKASYNKHMVSRAHETPEHLVCRLLPEKKNLLPPLLTRAYLFLPHLFLLTQLPPFFEPKPPPTTPHDCWSVAVPSPHLLTPDTHANLR